MNCSKPSKLQRNAQSPRRAARIIVEDAHRGAVGEEPPHDRGADEAGAARHQIAAPHFTVTSRSAGRSGTSTARGPFRRRSSRAPHRNQRRYSPTQGPRRKVDRPP